MAFNVFRIAASGGSNANSGTTSSVIYTSSIAVWDGTSQITGISGVLGVVTVGDWVNVASTYIAQVTATSSTGFTLSTTAKYGTAPGAGTVTVTDGGYFASQVAITAIFGTATVYNSTEFQWQAGNSAFTLSGTLTIGVVGTTTAPVWHRGFNTTPGDLDTGSTSLSYPTITAGANTVTFSGAFSIFSGLAVTSSRAGGALTGSGVNQKYFHCQLITTNASTSGLPLTAGGAGIVYVQCSFTGNAANNALIAVTQPTSFYGCYLLGAGSGSTQVGMTTSNGAGIVVVGCTINKTGSHGVMIATSGSASTVIIAGSTFNSCGGDSVRWVAAPATSVLGGAVINNTFVNSGTNGSGYDIDNASGTNTAIPILANNDSYNPASGHLNGFGDLFELNPLTEISNPFVSSTNLSLIPTAVGANAGLPGQWEAQTAGLGGFPDVGAWVRKTTAAGPVSLPINVGTPVGMASSI